VRYLIAWKWSALGILLLVCGCGESAPQPKTDLNEQEKQQVRELNQQRMDEWGKKK
jgi:hypothetical protein